LDEVKRADTFSFPKWRERAPKQKEPLNMEMAPVNQQTIGEMELVPSAVRPNDIEQRYRFAEVRTLRRKRGVQRRGGVHSSFLLGPGD
ncbi:MAG: hypothetical protein II650_08410, partial [Clostridia bacterium]|nr:hypothetical protein [Clostridia bacterium]